jgi:hypothetical protein
MVEKIHGYQEAEPSLNGDILMRITRINID